MDTVTRVVDVWLHMDDPNKQISIATDTAYQEGLELIASVPVVTNHGFSTTTSYIKLIFTRKNDA